MASKRMITAATSEYEQTRDAMYAAMAVEDGEAARELSIKLYQISYWLEAAMLGDSDRDCEWHSGWSPAPRKLRRATRQLAEVTA